MSKNVKSERQPSPGLLDRLKQIKEESKKKRISKERLLIEKKLRSGIGKLLRKELEIMLAEAIVCDSQKGIYYLRPDLAPNFQNRILFLLEANYTISPITIDFLRVWYQGRLIIEDRPLDIVYRAA